MKSGFRICIYLFSDQKILKFIHRVQSTEMSIFAANEFEVGSSDVMKIHVNAYRRSMLTLPSSLPIRFFFQRLQKWILSFIHCPSRNTLAP